MAHLTFQSIQVCTGSSVQSIAGNLYFSYMSDTGTGIQRPKRAVVLTLFEPMACSVHYSPFDALVLHNINIGTAFLTVSLQSSASGIGLLLQSSDPCGLTCKKKGQHTVSFCEFSVVVCANSFSLDALNRNRNNLAAGDSSSDHISSQFNEL